MKFLVKSSFILLTCFSTTGKAGLAGFKAKKELKKMSERDSVLERLLLANAVKKPKKDKDPFLRKCQKS